MKIADAFVLISKDDSPLRRGLASTRRDIEGWTDSVGGIIKNALGFSLGQAFSSGVTKILGSLRQLSSGLISGNADFEQYQTRFKVMLGSIDAARTRIEELAHFGATTPFDLPGVVEADIILQAFGFHSEEAAAKFGFSGEEIRRIAGDVASGTGASFQEMAENLGRFSSGATGQAIMRFQQMGAVTRDELRAMGVQFANSGELISPLPEAMNALLTIMQQKYGGMMDAQSSTFSGMMSNMRDWVENAQRTLGLPTFEILRDQLRDLLAFLDSGTMSNALLGLRDLIAALSAGVVGSVRGMGGAVKGAFEGMFGDTDQAMQGFANNAFGWGENIAISFAEGIYAATASVIAALSYLGALISYWLVPGSPPKLLPNLTAWGTGAAQAWLEGWTKADFSVFRDLSGLLERAINSLGLEDAAAVGSLINVRQWLRQAIEEINDMGDVSEETLRKITESAGNLAGPIGDYIQQLAEVARRTKEVEEAQARVNEITEKYDAILSPLHERLQGIRDEEQGFRDEQERARLQEILASATSGEREKEAARRALERLDLEKEIRDTEKDKNKELSEAEKQLREAEEGLKLAKDKLSLSKDYIDQLTEENELLKRQRELLEEIGGGGAGGAEKGAGGAPRLGIPEIGGPGGPGGGGSIFDRINDWLNRGPGGDDLSKRIENLMGRIQDIFKPLERDAERMGQTWEKAGRAFSRFLVEPIQNFMSTGNGQLLLDFLKNLALVAGGAALIGGLTKLAGGLLGMVGPVGLLVVGLVALVTILNDPRIQGGLASWGELPGQFEEIFHLIVDQLWFVDDEMAAWLHRTEGTYAQLEMLVGLGLWAVLLKLFEFKTELERKLGEIWVDGVILITRFVNDVLAKIIELKDGWLGHMQATGQETNAAWEAIRTFAQNAVGELKKAVIRLVSELRGDWGQQWTEIKKRAVELLQALIDAMPDRIRTLASTILTGIRQIVTDLVGQLGEWEDLGRSFIQGIINGASSLAGALADAVVTMVLDAVRAAAGAIISASPSRLTARVLGEPMGQGVLGGWEESMKNAQQQMAHTLVDAIPTPAMVGMGSGVAGGYGDIHETYNFYGQRDVSAAMLDIRQANERRRFNGMLKRR